MNKIFIILTITLSQLASAGLAFGQNPSIDMEGSWISGCNKNPSSHAMFTSQIDIHGTEGLETVTYYNMLDWNCNQSPASIVKLKYDLSFQGLDADPNLAAQAIQDVDIKYTSVTITLYDSIKVTFYNALKWCKHDDWQAGVPIECLDFLQSNPILLINPLYTIYKTTDSNLSMGKLSPFTTGANGSSQNFRIKALDDKSYTKKHP